MLHIRSRTICGKVLGEVGDHVAGGLHASRAPGETGSGGGVDAGGVVYKVGGEGGVIAHLLVAQVSGELMDQGGHHLHVAQLLGADVGEQAFGFRIGHGVALGEVAHSRTQLAVGAAVLADDEGGQLGVGSGHLYRELQLFLIKKHVTSPRFAHSSRARAP